VIEDAEFWARLARCVNDQHRSSPDNGIRFLWLDNIVPDALPLQSGGNPLTAIAFVSENDGRSFVQYRVGLSFGEGAVAACNAGNWPSILPKADVADWFKIDRAGKELTIHLV
jgi:hypothetical protein